MFTYWRNCSDRTEKERSLWASWWPVWPHLCDGQTALLQTSVLLLQLLVLSPQSSADLQGC